MAGHLEQDSQEATPPRPQPLWKMYEDGRLKALYGIERRDNGTRQAKLYAWVGDHPRRRRAS